MFIEFEEKKQLQQKIEAIRTEMRNWMITHSSNISHDSQRQVEEFELFHNIIQFVSRKWSIPVLWMLEFHPKIHFNELKRKLHGISTRTLSNTLKWLESQKLICREVKDMRPPKVQYDLSPLGSGLIEVSLPMLLYLYFQHEKKE